MPLASAKLELRGAGAGRGLVHVLLPRVAARLGQKFGRRGTLNVTSLRRPCHITQARRSQNLTCFNLDVSSLS